MSTQFGYKVVRVYKRKMISSHAFSHQRVQYSRRFWTKPKRGALAVFQTYDAAKVFTVECRQKCPFEIVPCIYIPFRGKPPYKLRVKEKQFASKVKLTRWYGEE